MVMANAATELHDGLVTPLTPAAPGRLPVLAFEDHLLRRFGGAEVVRLAAGDTFQVRRTVADEVWVLLAGEAEFHLDDLRVASPTHGARQAVRSTSPIRVLLPFGVRLEVRAGVEALLLRVMTHSEREDPPAAESH
jgi:5-deoxy-D-glucuronate isomerase